MSFRITDLTAITSAVFNDYLVMVDVHDTVTAPAGAAGSDKKITVGNLLESLGLAVNVLNHGADPLGVSDSGPAITNAITAAAGGVVFIPAGTYKITTPVTMTTACTILGAGRDLSILQLSNAVNDYAIKFTQGTGVAITGAHFSDFQINGNALNQTAGGGISAVGAVECNFERIHFTNCYNWGLALQAIPGGAFGHHNKIYACTFDNAANAGFGGGGWATSSDENLWTNCDFQFLGGATAPVGTYPVMLLDQAGLQHIENCVFVGSRGGNTNVLGIRTHNAGQTKVVGCTFDGVGGDGYFTNNSDNIVTGCTFTSIADQAGTAGVFAGVHLEFGTARNTITGNNFSSSATNGKTGYLIREESSGGAGANVIQGNTLHVQGTIAVGKIVTQGAASIVRSNIGYNPVGAETAPGIPATTVALVNPFNVDSSVFVTGGTVTAIAVNGVTTGATTGQFWVPAAGSITLTYSVAPTWTWIGH